MSADGRSSEDAKRIEDGRCMAPKDARPMVTTWFCVYPDGHDGNCSWQDSAVRRRERMKQEGWT